MQKRRLGEVGPCVFFLLEGTDSGEVVQRATSPHLSLPSLVLYSFQFSVFFFFL